MHKLLIVIEKVNDNYSCYSPDLPGVISTGKTKEETEKNMAEAIKMHIDGLIEDGIDIPKSVSFAEYITV
ncbi:MAG: type II toxin-antitoxin system HicB family antitoxin [bacterium]